MFIRGSAPASTLPAIRPAEGVAGSMAPADPSPSASPTPSSSTRLRRVESAELPPSTISDPGMGILLSAQEAGSGGMLLQTRLRPPAGSIEPLGGLGLIPGEVFLAGPAAIRNHFRQQVSDMRAAADREAAMEAAVGESVKLGRDPVSGAEVVLKAGDPGYDALRGAREDFTNLPREFEKLKLPPDEFADVMAPPVRSGSGRLRRPGA